MDRSRFERRLRALLPLKTALTPAALEDLSSEGPTRFRLTGFSPRMRLERIAPMGLSRVRLRGSADKETLVILRRVDAKTDVSRELVRLGPALSEGSLELLVEGDTELELAFAPTDATVVIEELSCAPVSPLEVAKLAADIARERREQAKPVGGARAVWDAARHDLLFPEIDSHALWRELNVPTERELSEMAAERLAYQPLISIVVPVFNPDLEELRRCIDSVRAQLYPRWELCLADDASTRAGVREELERQAKSDPRVKVELRKSNGHISAASNSALALATGEFVALLDHDDELAPHALFEVVKALGQTRDLDVIYSDEDKLDPSGERIATRFKPEWSPDLLLSQMYLGHLTVYRRALVERVGGFREGYEGSQDHDLALRVTELTDRVHHIPRVLYSWRMSRGSAAGGQEAKPYAIDAAKKALADALRRRGEGGDVQAMPRFPGHYVVRYPRPATSRISVIIPTRDRADLMRTALASFVRTAPADGWELCVVDNGSRESETTRVFNHFARMLGDRFRTLRVDEPFNFSRLINQGARATSGELLLLLNNDTESREAGWLDELGGWALRSSVGAVGCRLLYADGGLQHAGVALSSRDIAQHVLRGRAGDSPGHYGQLVSSSNVSALTAACMMVRRSVFEELGGFDETLGVSYSDVDFCLKAEARGYRNVLLGHVVVGHHESQSRGYELEDAQLARLASEAQLMRQRWGSELDRDVAQNPHLEPLSNQLRIRRGKEYRPGPFARGGDAAKARPSMKQVAGG